MKSEEKVLYSYMSKLKIDNDNFPIHKCFTRMWSDFNFFLKNKQTVEMDIYSNLFNIPLYQIDKRNFEHKFPVKPSHFDEKNLREKSAPIKIFKTVILPQKIEELFISKNKSKSTNLRIKEKMRKNNNTMNFQAINNRFIGSSHKENSDKDRIYLKMISFLQTLFIKKKPSKEVFYDAKENIGIRTNYDKYIKNMKFLDHSAESNIYTKTNLFNSRRSLRPKVQKENNVDSYVIEFINNLNKNVKTNKARDLKGLKNESFYSKVYEQSNNRTSVEKSLEKPNREIKKSVEKINMKDIHKILIDQLKEINYKYLEFKENNEKDFSILFPSKRNNNLTYKEETNKNLPKMNENTSLRIKDQIKDKNLLSKETMTKSKSLGNLLGEKKLITKNFIIK